jgi:hypothetical protein
MSQSVQQSNNLMSIYIPRVYNTHTEQSIKQIFYNNWFGEVSRVDFTPLTNQTDESSPSIMKSAFVHFNLFYNFDKDGWQLPDISNILEKIENGESYKFQVSNTEYWFLLKNKNPVPTTELNIHQIAENLRLLEEKVAEQNKTIENQKLVITQLLGGLYNHSTQNEKLEFDLSILNGKEYINDNKNIQDNFWPTTRQGDEHEDKIRDLENKVDFILADMLYEHLHGQQLQGVKEEDVEQLEDGEIEEIAEEVEIAEEEDNQSVSTHSSMPSLVSASSQDSIYSIPSVPSKLVDSLIQKRLEEEDGNYYRLNDPYRRYF